MLTLDLSKIKTKPKVFAKILHLNITKYVKVVATFTYVIDATLKVLRF